MINGLRSAAALVAIAAMFVCALPVHANDFVPVTLGGFSFNDYNGDNVYDPMIDQLQDGWIIDLYDSNFTLLQQEFSWGGYFAFTNVGPGTFYVCEEGFGDWFGGGCYKITTSSGVDVTDLEFANFEAGQISGFVFEDQTGDGFSPDDKPLDTPVTVDLYAYGGATLVDSRQAYAGWYNFSGLVAGIYTVQERVPAGYAMTAQTGATIYIFSGSVSSHNDFDNFLSLAVAMSPLQPVEGASFAGTVASIKSRPGAAAGDFAATIDWGDGASSRGSISTNPNGVFLVSGQHSYAEEGWYTVAVGVSDSRGNSTAASETVTVADAVLHASGQALPATRSAAFSGVVATFTDDDPSGAAADYTASIDWGDGTTSSGTIGGGVGVSGTHTFAEGRFTITTTVSDQGGARSSATSIVTVDLSPPTTSASVTSAHNQATVTLTATDTLTRVRASYYTINGGATQLYMGPFTLKRGRYTVRYWSDDVLGNAETPQAIVVTVNNQSG